MTDLDIISMEKVIVKSINKKIADKKFSLQFLPKSLELLSKVKTVKYKGITLKSAYLIDIVHSLILKYYYRKENSFNLSSIILKEKYGSQYNYYMSYLVDNNQILLTKNYLKGKNSRIYKLNEYIINGEISRYKNQDNILLKKYRNASSYIGSQHEDEILPIIKEKLIDDLYSVNIDYVRAIDFLERNNQDKDTYNKNKYSVDCIKDKHIFYHFDDFGRLHTNFTILKSFIRKNCLLIDGEETFEIDIPNSQPLFLYKIIRDNDFYIVDKSELEEFKLLTTSGQFYQHLIDKSGLSIDKKGIKEIVYKVFFGRNYKRKSDIIFEKAFPTIYEFIRTYKKEMSDYKTLSYSLQRGESNLIFNKIIKKITELNPEIKVITIHDSIICAKKYKDSVEIIFNQMLKDEFNI